MIIGAGFAGLEAARRLSRTEAEVLLVDRRNFHTFTPLLYQVATAGLEPDSIVKPVRSILRRAPNVRFVMADVASIDLARRQLQTSAGKVRYDYLIVATGSAVNYFGQESLSRWALPLKDLDDAIALRSHVLASFEAAALERDREARRRLTTVVVCGGGPTGVELAGALQELKQHVLRRDFPELALSEDSARVVLLEAADALLPGFPSSLQDAAARQLREIGVDVRLGSPVTGAGEAGVRLASGEVIPAGTVVWVAGVLGAGPEGLDLSGRARRARVEPTLQLTDAPEVLVAGDLAYLEDGGRALPMMAPVAIQEGRAAAENVLRLIRGESPRPFRYKDRGLMATIGRTRAVAFLPPLCLSGPPAWLVWLAVHLFWLIGFRNKFLVLVDWAWNYLLYEQGSRVIAGPARPRGAKEAGEARITNS
ncbi:MAG TPA: NAD(P)/FAD-dependent oxidoreductase [Dehalococcoidia bacterium]|nr:NAD(P)/FAD-dependent oxidoreductase [Dehalococcoidia bacterium]